MLTTTKKQKLSDSKETDTVNNGKKKLEKEVFTLMKNSLISTNSWTLNKKSSLKLELALKKKTKPDLKSIRVTIWEKF